MKDLTVDQIKGLPIKEQVEHIYELVGADDNDVVSDETKGFLLNFAPILKAILVANRKATGAYKEFQKIDEAAHKNIVVDQAVKLLEVLSPGQIMDVKVDSKPKSSVKDSIGFGFAR